LVDPNGETVFPPDPKAMNMYGSVYSNLQNNSTFKSLVSVYNSNNNDLRFSTDNTGYGVTIPCTITYNKTKNGKVVSSTTYWDNYISLNPDNMQTEIGLAKTVSS